MKSTIGTQPRSFPVWAKWASARSHVIADTRGLNALLAGRVDGGAPAVLIEVKINRATEVVRLIEKNPLAAEEFLLASLRKRIRAGFPQGEIFPLGKYSFLIWVEGTLESAKRGLHAFVASHSSWKIIINETVYYPKLSVGATGLTAHLGESLSRLEYACQRAESASGLRFFFAEAHDPGARDYIALRKGLRDVRRALDGQELGLYAQPIVPLRESRGLPKYELLLRHWCHGEVSPPGDILEKAAFNGITQDVDLYVVALLVEHFRALFGEHGEKIDTVSLNISGQSFASHGFNEELIKRFARHRIPAEKIILEITENVANENLPYALEMMREFKQAGFQLAMDDVGVGSSNFKNLFEFPVDYYKIDRSYCQNIRANRALGEFVRLVVNEAAQLGKKTVAEGLPGPEELDLARDMGVDYSQSYLTGEPRPLIDGPRAE